MSVPDKPEDYSLAIPRRCLSVRLRSPSGGTYRDCQRDSSQHPLGFVWGSDAEVQDLTETYLPVPLWWSIALLGIEPI